jgi:hypothetical protein
MNTKKHPEELANQGQVILPMSLGKIHALLIMISQS